MSERFRHIVLYALAACLVTGSTLPSAFAQTTLPFQQAFPKLTSPPGSDLIVGNLGSRAATAEVTFFDLSGSSLQTTFVDLFPATQSRLAVPFDGSALVRSTVPVSVAATLADALGGFEVIGPSIGSDHLIIPFSQGAAGNMEISVFNSEFSPTTVVIAAISPAGQTLGSALRTLAPRETLREPVNDFLPPRQFGVQLDVSHVVVRAATNFFGPDRRVHAVGTLRDFISISEGVTRPRTDAAVVNAVPVTEARATEVIPFFVQGGDFSTMIQVVNPSAVASFVALTARSSDGTLIPGTNPATIPLSPNGSVRMSAANIFNFTSPFTMGSISVQGAAPLVASAAISNVSQPSFAVIPATPGADTNFAFVTRHFNREFFTGLSLVNPTSSPANVTLRLILDDGTAVSRSRITIAPQRSHTRLLAEIFPEAEDQGFIHITSDVPIIAAALEGRDDATMLANLAPMHSQTDFQPPSQTRFLAVGAVRHNGVAFPDVTVQLSGPVSATAVSDATGRFKFTGIPAGTFAMRPQSAGFTFSPAEISFRISEDNSRDNNFAAELIVPTISSVTPSGITAGSPDTEIVVTGGPFISTSQIVVEGNPLSTTLGSMTITVGGGTGPTTTGSTGTTGTTTTSTGTGSTTALPTITVPVLRARMSSQSLVVPRIGNLVVRSSGPGGSVSSDVRTFVIGNPAPVLTALSNVPVPLIAGNPGFTLTVTGTAFMPGVSVRVGGAARPTVLQDDGTLRVTIPQDDLAVGANLRIDAINPSPTVAPSNSLTLPVLNPTPGLLSISPTSAEVRLEVNAPPLQLAVAGLGFRPGAKLLIGGIDVPTAFLSSTALTAQIPASVLQVGGSVQVTVRNAEPAVATSEALPLFLINLPPVLNSLDAGPLQFDNTRPTQTFTAPVIARGSNFGPNSIYEVQSCGGTTFAIVPGNRVSPQHVILSVLIACSGSYNVRIRTPQPGGGTSATLTFTVLQGGVAIAPTIATLSPNTILANSGTFTLTITGTNFEGGAVVSFGTAILFPATITSTTITVTIPGILVGEPGIFTVIVTNPSSTGSSNRVLFAVN